MKMDREELIKSLRVCGHANNCGNDKPWYERCEFYVNDCCVLKAAADMLEEDEGLLHEFVKPSIERAANVLNSMWDLLKENLAPQNEKTADEMFRDLGYEMCKSPSWEISYYRDEDARKIIVDIANWTAATFMFGVHSYLTWKELRAVCKLLDEMGVE